MSSATPALGTQLYRAGAGAGKTTTLTRHIVQLAGDFRQTAGRNPNIVVTTFTRKATQELKERLTLLARESGDPELLRYFSSQRQIHISTIHGVLTAFLRGYGHLLGLDPSFETVDTGQELLLKRQVLRGLLMNRPERQALLEDYDVSALAGMLGKFYEMSMDLEPPGPLTKETVNSSIKKWALENAAEAERVRGLILTESSDAKWVAYTETLEQLERILSQDASWEQSRHDILAALEGTKKPQYRKANPAVSEETNEALDTFLKKIKKVDEDEFDPAFLARVCEHAELFQDLGVEFTEAFREAKRTRGVLSFADLELWAKELAETQPDAAKAFSRQWDYWLVDEFQDTSPIQERLLRELIGERSYFVVGDPQQSIYLFRGARSEVFLEKEKEIQAAGGHIGRLSVNYRSRPELVHFFNDFFEGLRGNAFFPMEPSAPPSGELPSVARFFRAEDKDKEAEGIARYVRSLVNDGTAFEDICVLGRTNASITRVARALYRAGLPTQLHRSAGFRGRREIQDAIAILKFLINPHDDENLYTLLRSPWFHVHDDILVRLSEKIVKSENNASRWERLIEMRAEVPLIEDLSRLLVDARERGISAVFQESLQSRGVFDFSHVYDPSGRRESNLWKLVMKLRTEEHRSGFSYADFINSFSLTNPLAGEDEAEATAALEPNRINLMTIHHSKGLQFKHVIVPEAGSASGTTKALGFIADREMGAWSIPVPVGEEGKAKHPFFFKTYLENLRSMESAESERVLYVALTRAKESVFLSWSGEAKADSWIGRSGWNLAIGRHENEHYSYEIVENIPEAEVSAKEARPVTNVRSLYRDLTSTQPRRVSVSALLEGEDGAAEAPSLNRVRQRVQSSARGVEVHRLLELLKFHDPVKVRQLIPFWFGARTKAVESALDYIAGLQDPPLRRILSGGQVEWGFLFRKDGHLIEGQIDLWGEADGTVWIVDYKTGNPNAVEKAFRQLSLYAEALLASGVTKPIMLSVLFPMDQKSFARKYENYLSPESPSPPAGQRVSNPNPT